MENKLKGSELVASSIVHNINTSIIIMARSFLFLYLMLKKMGNEFKYCLKQNHIKIDQLLQKF